MSELTAVQAQDLALLEVVQYDRAALKSAKDFIKDDPYLYTVFVKHYDRVVTEPGLVARTTKAISEATETLKVLTGK